MEAQENIIYRLMLKNPRERSHITSSAEGGGGFQKMTLDDGGEGGGLRSDDVIQNRSISGFFIS